MFCDLPSPGEAQRKRVRREGEEQGNEVRDARKGVPNRMDFAESGLQAKPSASGFVWKWRSKEMKRGIPEKVFRVKCTLRRHGGVLVSTGT